MNEVNNEEDIINIYLRNDKDIMKVLKNSPYNILALMKLFV